MLPIFMQGGACRFAVIESSLDRTFARRAEAIGLRYTKVSQFRGYNLGSGGRITSDDLQVERNL